MRQFLGVPWSQAARSEYIDALLIRESGDTRKALDVHDAYLEVVSSRSSALIGVYGIFLAISVFLVSGVSTTNIRIAIEIFSVFQLFGVILLFPCLWIVWRSEPKIYNDVDLELKLTIELLMLRSILLNASVVISLISISFSILLFVLNRYLIGSTS